MLSKSRSTILLAAASAALMGSLAVSAAKATILATEDFSGVTLTGGPILLAGVNDGTGWSTAKNRNSLNGWYQQNLPAAGKGIPGYNVSDTTPLTGADNNNYAAGGYNYQGSGRSFDLSSTGTFATAGLITTNPTTHVSTIGVAGATILVSALVRSDNGNPPFVFGLSGNAEGAFGTAGYANAAFGYAASNTNNDWTLDSTNGTTTLTNTVSNVAFVKGTPAELVMEVQYTTGTAANLSLWVNPAGYSGSNPTIPLGTPNATFASTNATFTDLFFGGTHGTGGASFTDLVVATPSASIPEPATLGLMAVMGVGLLLVGRKRKVA